MEELHHSWYIYIDYDIDILFDYLWWPISANDDCKSQATNLIQSNCTNFLFFFLLKKNTDIIGASEML